MVAGLAATARSLWRRAPYWRMSVIGATGFTVLSLVYLWGGGGDRDLAPPPRPIVSTPPAPADPASDARLADFERTSDDASKLPAAGARCEQIAAAYDALTPDDLRRGRSVVLSSAARLKALAAGEVCRNNITSSNAHFLAVTQAVTAAAQPAATASAMQTAADAPKLLDAFDRSRTRFATDGAVIARAGAFAADLAASDARVHALTADVDAYQSAPAAASAVRAAETLDRLTPFDRGRLSAAQGALLATAGEAARAVAESRARLSRIGRLLAATKTDATTEAKARLIDAIATITRFDREIATPEQKQTLEAARATATEDAWTLARQRVASLGKEERLDQLQPAAAIVPMLRDLPQDALTAEQRQILAKAQGAADTLAASDTRLHALTDAYAAWQGRGVAAADPVTDAVRAITPLDRGRFGDAERKAMTALAKADQIIRGPELGFNADTKDRLPIVVQSGSDAAVDGRMAVSLANALRRAGFPVAANPADAALTLSVSFKGSDGLKQDLSSGFFAWVTTARAAFTLAWVSDGSPVIGGDVAQSGRSQDQTAVQSQALLADIDAIVARIQAKAAK